MTGIADEYDNKKTFNFSTKLSKLENEAKQYQKQLLAGTDMFMDGLWCRHVCLI